jgi:hypothetical protein
MFFSTQPKQSGGPELSYIANTSVDFRPELFSSPVV